VRTLYGHGPHERIYLCRTDDQGKATVQFGDGRNGARLSTGQENVRATYRKGIGLGGLVKAGQLKLLMSRPLGLKDVTNPIEATGGADPESFDEAQRNAPLTVLTLDRIVSLRDYEDFCRAYAGISKALATWTWDGERRGVFVTVAGPKGAEIRSDSDTYKNLLSAMQKAGDSRVSIRVDSYRPAFFKIAAKVKTDPDRQTEQVLKAIEKPLRSYFSFDRRDFGQGVTLSEVMSVIQSVAGVVAVAVDALYRTDGLGGDGLKQPLSAAVPQPGAGGTVSAAELLLLDPGPLSDMGVML
jgi:predicted phage baseplate assembly protein